MAIKKVKLNYVPAISRTPSVKVRRVSSSRLRNLDRVIQQKARQNEAERVASLEAAGRYTVQ